MNINLTLIAQAVTFALFIWITVKFIWPWLMGKIEERQKQIADGLAAGEQGRRELEAAGRRAHEELAKARERVGEIIGSAERREAQMLEEAKAAAKAEAERILAAAKADIDQQIARAREMLREQVAALAVAGAEKILRREVDSETHAELLGRLRKEIHQQFVELKNELEGVVEVEIRTAFPLDNAQINGLVADISGRLKRRVQPRVAVDRELIGGVRIPAGDEVIDCSVRGKLEEMAAALKA